ncbi:DNA-methyltransferase [Salibacterium qingdaonense]|uniref:Site-specific DNA-methyltransferase (Adenine-specific) n=1 Tax=Salibacterium qingdaonense TaxID=266892 RepID=A0A1I4QPC3_9BACI|nr:site-specific DNA-methyltransferase [Salibacterium qingdaonense]SFM41887.1 site-specific DNA-methyltransferase (adenine-specific) [Salibacterium qingdaonense]
MFNNRFFSVLNITNNHELKLFAKNTKIPLKKLKYYNEEYKIPHKEDLNKILESTGLKELEFKIKMGLIDYRTADLLSEKATEITNLIDKENSSNSRITHDNLSPSLTTQFGELYNKDCNQLMRTLPPNSVDMIFADPPFNLNKVYDSGMNDELTKEEYLRWTEEWVLNSINLLKEGGTFFVWNLPKWNTYISSILDKYLNLKHWIAVDIKYRLPIKKRLYPSHYSLLYYTKGEKPNTFNEQRLPLEVCRHCGGEQKDYGGYKSKLNPNGINLSDVWTDIPPVRHKKYKTRGSNELSLKLLERVISLATNEGDVVFDPFGGSGSTYIASEILNRQWIGTEVGPVDSIIKRFEDIEEQRDYIFNKVQANKNTLFTQETRNKRRENRFWLPEDFN